MILPLWFRNLRYRLFYATVTRPWGDLVRLGSVCSWTISPTGLTSESNVFCAGAGNDISFEKDMMHKFGCKVTLVDPSPTGVATVARDAPSEEKLQFFPFALSDHDGHVPFSAPLDAKEGSYRKATGSEVPVLNLPCKSLRTFMSDLGWGHIDLLKIDIEGGEFAVLAQIVNSRLRVRQICVEFHHGVGFSHTPRETVRTILNLRRAGYNLIHHVQWDHTFLLSGM